MDGPRRRRSHARLTADKAISRHRDAGFRDRFSDCRHVLRRRHRAALCRGRRRGRSGRRGARLFRFRLGADLCAADVGLLQPADRDRILRHRRLFQFGALHGAVVPALPLARGSSRCNRRRGRSAARHIAAVDRRSLLPAMGHGGLRHAVRRDPRLRLALSRTARRRWALPAPAHCRELPAARRRCPARR